MKSKHMAIKSHQNTMLVGSVLGALAAVAVSLLLLSGLTSLSMKGDINENTANGFVFVFRIIAVLLGVLLGAGITKEKTLITAGIITAIYLVTTIGIGIVVYDGSFVGFGLGALSVLLGSVAGYLIRLKVQNKSFRSKKIRL